MTDDELDHVLSKDTDIAPSPAFARNVMDAVRREASAPPPIPFPWTRALAGLILCLAAMVIMCVASIQSIPLAAPARLPEAAGPSFWTIAWPLAWSNLSWVLTAAKVGGLGWIITALVLTFASVRLSLRLTGRRI